MSEKVRQMFANISGKYDLLNSIISLGTHKSWRRKAVKYSEAAEGMSVLDCACGTGDFAFEYKKAVGDGGKVIATDFCNEMLTFIPNKIVKNNLQIDFEQADVMNLRFGDNSFDIACIGFGIRNVDNPEKGLSEMARVVNNGGKVVVLETGQPPKGLFGILYKIFSNVYIPLAGLVFAGNLGAYRYFKETASKFPFGNEFVDIMKSTNLISEVNVYPQIMGVSYIYVGTVNKSKVES